jgi:phage shock protein E
LLHISVKLRACALLLAMAPAALAGNPVTPGELASLLARGQKQRPLVLDVRTPEEYAAGHVPGAILIPHDQLALRLDALQRDRPIVVYCRTGRRSGLAETLLRQHGHEVSQLQGSWLGWQAAGLEFQTSPQQDASP